MAVGELISSKPPLPLSTNQVKLLAPPPTLPDMVWVLPAQMVAGGPALAVAAGSFVVIVKVTVLFVISAAPGVYTAVGEVLLLKVPSPLVDQVRLVALPPTLPAKVCGLPAHTLVSAPALAVAEGLMVKVICTVNGSHAPGGSLVISAMVTVPADISAADGV